jgi:hypothetical protein
MTHLKYTLLADGSSDANLLPIIDWTLKTVAGVALAEGTYADLWRLRKRPASLDQRIVKAVEFFPCTVLFVHRDAEKEPAIARSSEIKSAVETAARAGCAIPAVAVIPVRMIEAWLLFNEVAIRNAAGNPTGVVPLNLPAWQQTEELPDPKQVLQDALRTASELRRRRLNKFRAASAFRRIVDFVDDFSPLRKLTAFMAFENSVRHIAERQWAPGFYGY